MWNNLKNICNSLSKFVPFWGHSKSRLIKHTLYVYTPISASWLGKQIEIEAFCEGVYYGETHWRANHNRRVKENAILRNQIKELGHVPRC